MDYLSVIQRKFLKPSVRGASRSGHYADRSRRIATVSSSILGEPSLVQESDSYVFLNLPHQDGILPRVTLTSLLEDGATKTHDQWRDYAAQNKEGISIPNSVLWFQMLRQLYTLRNNERCQEAVESCVADLRSDFNRLYLHTGTKVVYDSGYQANIDHLEMGDISSLLELDVPEFTRFDNNWGYLTLASEQPEALLGTMTPLSSPAAPVLEALFGDGYEEAGAVFQYVTSRKNNNQTLREVRLWVPTASNRNTERCVVLGVYGDRFDVGADGSISLRGPARGVVVVPSSCARRSSAGRPHEAMPQISQSLSPQAVREYLQSHPHLLDEYFQRRLQDESPEIVQRYLQQHPEQRLESAVQELLSSPDALAAKVMDAPQAEKVHDAFEKRIKALTPSGTEESAERFGMLEFD